MFCRFKCNYTLKGNHSIFSKHLVRLYVIGACLMFTTGVFSQEPSLAERVFERYQTLLQRDDIQALLPTVLTEIKKPDNQALLTPETITVVLENPDLLKQFVPNIADEFITLLKEDQEIRTMLRDADVQALFQDTTAIDELTALLDASELSLAERIFERYRLFFQRPDIQQLLPTILIELKSPENQELLNPTTIKLVVDNPDALKIVVPQIDDEFITLLKEDAEIKKVLRDTDVQLLLQTPAAIDELAVLLSLTSAPIIVRIVPASVESPNVGQQLVVTVDIAKGREVGGYQGTVQFDTTALRYVSLTHGTYLSGEVLDIRTRARENKITFAKIAIGSTAAAAAGTLVTITFDVINVKASMLTLSDVLLATSKGQELPVTVENAKIVEPPKKPWDVNKDGEVNILDLTFVASYFGNPDAPPAADVNNDGSVNILDLTLVASHFGE